MKPSLMLNMIVRNEGARIERCLASVLPYVKAAAIIDTGSTDDTIEKIHTMCERHGVPCIVGSDEFKDFSQARNSAFQWARDYNGKHDIPFCQFALLVDADMQLIITDENAFADLDARAASYDMMQKGGALSYANRRLINLNWRQSPYVGVTHEYVDIPAHGMIKGASFVDHADGSNRANKFERDAALLEKALETDPNNARSWYYLGNTYRDMKRWGDALRAYERRIELGGWNEEVHSAMMHRAECHRHLGADDMFISMMVNAYNYRPTRAEPLYELAKFYREKGDNAAALLFATRGLTLKRPNDVLFVNDFVYAWGLRYEYSIAGYYDDAERPGALAVTNALALDPACPDAYRRSARANLYWHTKPLAEYAPSFVARRLDTQLWPIEGYTAMNPSVTNHAGYLKCNVRYVNYRIDEHGRYLINGTQSPAQPHAPIDTRNMVVTITPRMEVTGPGCPVVWDRPAPEFNLVTGLEDVRLWSHRGALWFNACVRERLPHGTPQQMIGRLDYDYGALVCNPRPISDGSTCEKNWMHIPGLLPGPNFVYRLGTIIRDDGVKVHLPTPFHTGDISGSSQCIPFNNGFLAVVHEAITGPNGKRTYWHRFAWMSLDGTPRRISKPFVFFDRQIEFCAGIAVHPDNQSLVLSFGVRDEEAWLCTVDQLHVSAMLEEFHEG